jgi:cytochrome c553
MPHKYPAFAVAISLATLPLLAGCMTKQTVGNDATIAGTVQVCSSCHGLEGRNGNPNFPILAGQRHDYLVAQLKAFRGKTRADPHAHTYMWGMAAKLTDSTIDGVATYYASQKPEPGTVQNSALVAAGQPIYKNGVAATNVPACGDCHGDTAAGTGEIPRLASQHKQYLVDQLSAFKTNTRANEMMHANALNLTPQDIQALSAYLASRS